MEVSHQTRLRAIDPEPPVVLVYLYASTAHSLTLSRSPYVSLILTNSLSALPTDDDDDSQYQPNQNGRDPPLPLPLQHVVPASKHQRPLAPEHGRLDTVARTMMTMTTRTTTRTRKMRTTTRTTRTTTRMRQKTTTRTRTLAIQAMAVQHPTRNRALGGEGEPTLAHRMAATRAPRGSSARQLVATMTMTMMMTMTMTTKIHTRKAGFSRRWRLVVASCCAPRRLQRFRTRSNNNDARPSTTSTTWWSARLLSVPRRRFASSNTARSLRHRIDKWATTTPRATMPPTPLL